MIQTYALLFVAASACAAFIAAILNYLAIRTNIDNEKSKVLLQCLEKYFHVRKDRTKAILERKKEFCEEYYRELLDLTWTEFHLWKKGYIDDDVMMSWSIALYRNHNSEDLPYLNEHGAEVSYRYEDYWKYIIETNYFERTDPFIEFMNNLHLNKIDDAMKMKTIKK
jgi:hypothetical protein